MSTLGKTAANKLLRNCRVALEKPEDYKVVLEKLEGAGITTSGLQEDYSDYPFLLVEDGVVTVEKSLRAFRDSELPSLSFIDILSLEILDRDPAYSEGQEVMIKATRARGVVEGLVCSPRGISYKVSGMWYAEDQLSNLVNLVYPFYDDGKVGRGSRQYLAMVIREIQRQEAFEIVRQGKALSGNEEGWGNPHNLTDYWDSILEKDHEGRYDHNSDTLLEIAVPLYDANLLYCVKLSNGNWYSMNIQNFWQAGLLDVTGACSEYLREDLREKMEGGLL